MTPEQREQLKAHVRRLLERLDDPSGDDLVALHELYALAGNLKTHIEEVVGRATSR
jgi:hypothetical protein